MDIRGFSCRRSETRSHQSCRATCRRSTHLLLARQLPTGTRMVARSRNSSSRSSSCSTSPFVDVSYPWSLHCGTSLSQLVFHTIEYAGATDIFAQTCSGICYDDYVAGSPSNYNDAYFEVKYVRAYGIPGELTKISSGALPLPRASIATAGTLILAAASSALLFWL